METKTPTKRERRPRFTPRDLEILREVFNFRFLHLQHVHALFGTHGELEPRADGRPRNDTNLARRLRRLADYWDYLHRPKATRSERRLQNQTDVYTLTHAGARVLAERFRGDPAFEGISEKNWSKEMKINHIDHDLAVADVLVAARLTAERYRFLFEALYFDQKDERKIPLGKREYIEPDAWFTLALPTKDVPTLKDHGPVHENHYLVELDFSGSMNPKKMREKYARYTRWWIGEGGNTSPVYKFTRVLTITQTPERAQYLRALVREEGIGFEARAKRIWPGLLFAHRDAFTLEKPQLLFGRIFQTADEDEPRSLLHPFVSI